MYNRFENQVYYFRYLGDIHRRTFYLKNNYGLGFARCRLGFGSPKVTTTSVIVVLGVVG